MRQPDRTLKAPGLGTNRAIAILGLAICGASCAAPKGKIVKPPVNSKGPVTQSRAVPNFADKSQTAELSSDRKWQAAQSGDTIDLVLLARAEGATGLLERAELGGSAGLLALKALVYADDRELALRPLCTWLQLDEGQIQPPVLSAIVGIVSTPSEPTEALDPEALHLCDRQLRRAQETLKTSATNQSTADIGDQLQSAVDLVTERLTPEPAPAP